MKVKIRSRMAEAGNRAPRLSWEPEPYIKTTWEGEAPVETPEDAFRFFNVVEPGDDERLRALGYRLPSLSVGDEVTLDGTAYVVAPVGFLLADEVDLEGLTDPIEISRALNKAAALDTAGKWEDDPGDVADALEYEVEEDR